ncbi:unnamed protein product [Parajaminaea phylloscopi]
MSAATTDTHSHVNEDDSRVKATRSGSSTTTATSFSSLHTSPCDSYCPLSLAVSSLPSHLVSPKTKAHARRHGLFSVSQLMLLSHAQLRNLLKLSDTELLQGEGWRERLAAHCWREGGQHGSVGERRRAKRRRLLEGVATDEALSTKVDRQPRPRRDHYVTLGDADLDATAGGGVRCGAITEIAGESSTGKSQLIMQMAVFAALGWTPADLANDNPDWPPADLGQNAGTVAILVSEGDAQATLVVRRMLQMAEELIRRSWQRRADRGRRHGSPGAEVGRVDDVSGARRLKGGHREILEKTVKQASSLLLRNIRISPIRDLEALEHALTYTLPGLARRLLESHGSPPLRLVILDSLAPLFYSDQPGSSFAGLMLRTRWTNLIADELKKLARYGMHHSTPSPAEHLKQERSSDAGEEVSAIQATPPIACGAAIVIINHVSDAFEKDLAALYQILKSQRAHAATADGTDSQAQPPQQQHKSQACAVPANKEPPLTYAAQSPFFSGLLASVKDLHTPRNETHDAAGLYDDARLTAPMFGKQAALGHVWNNSINARIFLSRRDVFRLPDGESHGEPRAGADLAGDAFPGDDDGQFEAPLRLRALHMVFAPWAPARSSTFVITKAGLSVAGDECVSPLAAQHARSLKNDDDDDSLERMKHTVSSIKCERADDEDLPIPPGSRVRTLSEVEQHDDAALESILRDLPEPVS